MENNVVHELIITNKNEKLIDNLYSIYREDKIKCRIYWRINQNLFNYTRAVYYNNGGNYFSYVIHGTTFMMSTNNRLIKREKILARITYNKNGFYYIVGKRIRLLTINNINNFSFVGNFGSSLNEIIIERFINKFGWVRNLHENFALHNVSFNLIKRRRIFNTNKLLKYIYGCDIVTAKIVNQYSGNHGKFIKRWLEIKKVLINTHYLTPERLGNNLFMDTIRFAEMLNEKVNCMWSDRKIKEMHDKWNKIINKVILETTEERDLLISNVFIEFEKFSGYQMLKTTIELIKNGQELSHCVGTYANIVDSGYSAIFVVYGYTLQVSTHIIDGKMYLSQFCGVKNSNPPSTYILEVGDMINRFNDEFCSLPKEREIIQELLF